jgi:hypothetical protein
MRIVDTSLSSQLVVHELTPYRPQLGHLNQC